MVDAMKPNERAWLRKVQAAVSACPNSGWGFYTVGDGAVEIYDKAALKRLGYYDNGQDLVVAIQDAEVESGETIALGSIKFPAHVEGVCG